MTEELVAEAQGGTSHLTRTAPELRCARLWPIHAVRAAWGQVTA
jgi:hypothetical protein